MNTEKMYWLKRVLLDLESGEESRLHRAWNELFHLTNESIVENLHISQVIAAVYLHNSSAEEQKVFLVELKQLIQLSKKDRFSVELMELLIQIVFWIKKLDEFADVFARSFVFVWRNAKERDILARAFLSHCLGNGPSDQICKAVSYLREFKWIPRKYALDTCCVLLETKPDRWFNTLARMMPVMSRYKNKLLREEGVTGRKTWSIAEESLKYKISELGLFMPFDKGNAD